MKVCKTCGIEKSFDDFYLKSDARDNRNPHCKVCDKARHRAYYKRNKRAAKNRAREWAMDNPEARAKIRSKWQKANPDKECAKAARYRFRKQNAVPPWFCKPAVDAYYAKRPKTHEVDHIVALANGGTHSQDNLQFLPISVNRQKGAKTNFKANI